MAKSDNTRRYPGVGGSHHNPVHIAQRRVEAKERQEAWSKLTLKEQLAALDRRLGKDTGAAKQRARLASPVNTKPGPQVTHQEAGDRQRLKAKERRAEGL